MKKSETIVASAIVSVLTLAAATAQAAPLVHCADKSELCNHLVGWLGLEVAR